MSYRTDNTPKTEPDLSAIPKQMHYAIRLLREQMETDRLPGETIVEIFAAVSHGYCIHCGGPALIRGQECQCWNDE